MAITGECARQAAAIAVTKVVKVAGPAPFCPAVGKGVERVHAGCADDGGERLGRVLRDQGFDERLGRRHSHAVGDHGTLLLTMLQQIAPRAPRPCRSPAEPRVVPFEARYHARSAGVHGEVMHRTCGG